LAARASSAQPPFLRALKTSGFDDLAGAAWRAINDDDLPDQKQPAATTKVEAFAETPLWPYT